MKNRKKNEKEKNCSRLTSIGKSSSHPNVATISFEDLSAGYSSSSSTSSDCSKLLPALVLPPPPVWCGVPIYVMGEGTMGRDHIIGRNSYCHAFGPAAARWLLILLIC